MRERALFLVLALFVGSCVCLGGGHGVGKFANPPARDSLFGTGHSGRISSPPTDYKFAAYFANWAQYHHAPYGPYTPKDLSGVVDDLNYILYAFAKFDPTSFQVQVVEPKDPEFYKEILAYKSQNPSLKLILSIGGWNFDSAYFSWMAGSKQNRTMFISSMFNFVKEHNLDGIDLDWEYPCSPPRTDYVKFSCTRVTPHTDPGGRCPDDINNLLALVTEIRNSEQERGASPMWISLAGQAAQKNYQFFKLKELSALIDMWHVMSYDYSVSDLPSAHLTAPNSPLYNPKVVGDAGDWSVNTTVMGYLAAGVPAKKIMIGAALYGHTWYAPGLQPSQWQKYDVTAELQDQCCGHFKVTYGAKYGEGSQLCGTLMISEIQAKLGNLDGFTDKQSQTVIGYSSDGTWISFDNKNTFVEKAKYVKTHGLAGVFAFDTSEDTMSGGQFTYEMSHAIAQELGGSSSTSTSSTSTGTTTSSGHCAGKGSGMYCISQTQFVYCPQNDVETCPSGTVCTQHGNYILCSAS